MKETDKLYYSCGKRLGAELKRPLNTLKKKLPQIDKLVNKYGQIYQLFEICKKNHYNNLLTKLLTNLSRYFLLV